MKGKAEDIGMKRLCSILLALLLLLGACSGEESKNGLPQENLPIGFSGVITMTRGTGKFATAGELKNVGVFAYFTSLWKNNWMREHGLIVRSSSGRTIPPRIKSVSLLMPLT